MSNNEQNYGEQTYEIMQLMKDNKRLMGDVNHAAHIIRSMLNEKYISPIQKAIEKENRRARKNPCKNARLLEALKPFVNKANHKALDDTINTLYLIETFKGMQNHMPKPRIQSQQAYAEESFKDPSVHENGIYDKDEKCLIRKQNPVNPIFMALLLSALI